MLEQNYPNPFNPSTKIKFTIPRHEGQTNVGNEDVRSVQLKVYDILGNELSTLVNEQKAPGIYEVEFNGNELTSGLYIYKLQVNTQNGGSFTQSRKMILLK